MWRPAFGGRAMAINIGARSRFGSDDVRSVIVELATQHGLRVYDPQSDEISGDTRRRLLQRLRRR